MLTFISCAKTMTHKSKAKTPAFLSTPVFGNQAAELAVELGSFSADELGKLLHINQKLAAENYLRYMDFFSEANPTLPAILSYTGMVFKRINAQDFTEDDFLFAQKHLLITSFLYGLLRPLDQIKNYRLEGNVKLNTSHGESIFNFWKSILTDFFITSIKEQGGILVNLASEEMKNLFDWRQVCKEVRIITPEFYTVKDGKLTAVTVYAKMCRGELTRHIIKNRIEDPNELKQFCWEGFVYREEYSKADQWFFVLS